MEQYIGLIEFDNGDYYDVVKLVREDGTWLEAGCVTNTGFIRCYGIDWDDDESLDGNLSNLYDHIIECKEQDADIRELLKDY